MGKNKSKIVRFCNWSWVLDSIQYRNVSYCDKSKTEEIVEMMDNTLADRVPGAGRRKGTYPGRISDTISFTVIVSNIGQGAAMDKIETFFTDASRMLGEVQHKREGIQKQWKTASKAAAQLPNL